MPAQEKKDPSFPGEKDDPRVLPVFYRGGYSFKVDPYIEMAVSLQKQGKEKAIQALKDGKLGRLRTFGWDGHFVCVECCSSPKGDYENSLGPAIGEPAFSCRRPPR